MYNLKQIISLLHLHIKVKGTNNEYDKGLLLENDVRLRIKGSNNKVITGKNCSLKNVVISIYGDNNTVTFGDDVAISNVIIEMGFKWHNTNNNSSLTIGGKTTTNHISVIMLEDNSHVKIGENCMFASGIELWATDTHSITDLEGNLLNYDGNIIIGDNVWVGKDVKICKNAQISDNSVVGFSSVVSSKFTQQNVIIAGNPAKIVKENIKWNRLSPQVYLQSQNKKTYAL